MTTRVHNLEPSPAEEGLGLLYASGEVPMRGDTVASVELSKPQHLRGHHPEMDEIWIVTKVVDNMIRAKCERAPLWRQAFYVTQMNLCKRRDENLANRKRVATP